MAKPRFRNTSTLGGMDLSSKRASWLDIPYVFELLMEGSFSGSFSDRFLQRKWWGKLFFYTLSLFFRHSGWWGNNANVQRMWLIYDGNEQIGFYHLVSSKNENQQKELLINLICVSHSYRNQRVASRIIQRLIDHQPQETLMVVYCTKYARAMQRVLTKLKFERDKILHVNQLTRFILCKATGTTV